MSSSIVQVVEISASIFMQDTFMLLHDRFFGDSFIHALVVSNRHSA